MEHRVERVSVHITIHDEPPNRSTGPQLATEFREYVRRE